MGLETGTYVSDLVVTNPPSGDQISQGDDHIRLIKTVLKNTFPGASKAIAFPTATVKTANFTIVSTDQLNTFLVDTTAGVTTATLPTLAAGDAGWECYFVKTNTGTNPLLITPPSGTIQSGDIPSLARTRRCIPGAKSRAYWTGSNWFADRAVNVPVGTVLDFDGASLPVGYEWPNGQTLASASTNYPDYNSRKGSGVTRDLRGRLAIGKDDMGGSSASRVTLAGSGIDGGALGATGGAETVVLSTGQLPAHGHTFTGNALGGHQHTIPFTTNLAVLGSGGTVITSVTSGGGSSGTTSVSGGTPSGTTDNTGSGTAVNNMPPGAVMNKILVVE